MKIKQKIAVHAYKYNGWLYRSYEFPKIIDITPDFICLNLTKTRIISQNDDGRNFHSTVIKDSLWFFFPDKWYNLIVTKKIEGKLNYYFNMASPYIFEEDAIKYYDFDLDIQIFDIDQKKIKQLDHNEFVANQVTYGYPKELVKKIIETQKQLTKDLKSNMFQEIFNIEQLEKYMEIAKRLDNKKTINKVNDNE